eukprot:TRINITY_DN17325_c0_g1_i2.p1 TRINITY_DN17325_c0_g1~~TRINITY_DN17325_c0_g1_i2.p1  ORF type:complete len:174 (-),score=37.11 TRINITY_DN17325_c0_g1_i2:208-729(-)
MAVFSKMGGHTKGSRRTAALLATGAGATALAMQTAGVGFVTAPRMSTAGAEVQATTSASRLQEVVNPGGGQAPMSQSTSSLALGASATMLAAALRRPRNNGRKAVAMAAKQGSQDEQSFAELVAAANDVIAAAKAGAPAAEVFARLHALADSEVRCCVHALRTCCHVAAGKCA